MFSWHGRSARRIIVRYNAIDFIHPSPTCWFSLLNLGCASGMAGGTRLKLATCNVFSFLFFFKVFLLIQILNRKFLSTYVFCFYSIHFLFDDRVGGHVSRVVFYVLQIRSHSCLNAKIYIYKRRRRYIRIKRRRRRKRMIILDHLANLKN